MVFLWQTWSWPLLQHRWLLLSLSKYQFSVHWKGEGKVEAAKITISSLLTLDCKSVNVSNRFMDSCQAFIRKNLSFAFCQFDWHFLVWQNIFGNSLIEIPRRCTMYINVVLYLVDVINNHLQQSCAVQCFFFLSFFPEPTGNLSLDNNYQELRASRAFNIIIASVWLPSERIKI